MTRIATQEEIKEGHAPTVQTGRSEKQRSGRGLGETRRTTRVSTHTTERTIHNQKGGLRHTSSSGSPTRATGQTTKANRLLATLIVRCIDVL